MKVAILSSYTVDLVAKQTAARLNLADQLVDWYLAPIGQWRQEILASTSKSKQFQAQIVVILLDAHELLENSEETFELFRLAAKEYAGAKILIHNCVPIFAEPLQLLEWNRPDSIRLAAARFNCHLAALAAELSNLYILDFQGLSQRFGLEQIIDPRFYYLAKMPFSSSGIEKIAEQLALAMRAICAPRKKCLVLDLDNTLWGGTIGEDGVEHLKLSNDGEGRAFYDLQMNILKLQQTGVILAICSKNDENVCLDAIENHPYMVLRKAHFVTWRINWSDKVQNLRSIAKELNIGLDSLVFLDDSKHEREAVRAVLPEVQVPELPSDPSYYAQFIAYLPCFETFAVTAEDLQRSKMYKDDQKRAQIRNEVVSLESFFDSLRTKIRLQETTSFNIPRIAQLTMKTNQFNLTTRRYSESEIEHYAKDRRWKVLALSASDRLGDLGLVGTAIWEDDGRGRAARLDTFLVSCRVLGRGIEQAFMCAILNEAREQGFSELRAQYIQTENNQLAVNFLVDNGFTKDDVWHKIQVEAAMQPPSWITIESKEAGNISES